jgi:hypothetical protein
MRANYIRIDWEYKNRKIGYILAPCGVDERFNLGGLCLSDGIQQVRIALAKPGVR